MSEQTENIGAVSQSRYEQIAAELREVVEQQTHGQFTIGDRALEIEPIRLRGGSPVDAVLCHRSLSTCHRSSSGLDH